MNTSKYSCSIIIVAYNSCDFIPACLRSIRDAIDGIDAEVIVLDNGSVEPIEDKIKNYFPEVKWLDSKENLGFGKGCNFAEKHATKPYLFFINPDTIISKDAFTQMLDFMEVHPEAGTVGCRILNEDGSLQRACRRSFPTIISAVSKTIGLASLFPKSKLLASYNMTYANPEEETEVDAISGSFFCIRKDVYDKLKGFDEDFFMYGEDLDLCFRTKEMGLKNYYTPATNILHFKGQSCKTRRFESYLNFYQAMLIFARKHKNLYFVPNFLVSFGIILAAFLGIFSRLLPHFWKMIFDAFVILICAVFGFSMTSNGVEFSGVPIKEIALLGVEYLVALIALGEYATPSLEEKNIFKKLLLLSALFGGSILGVEYYNGMPLNLSVIPLVFVIVFFLFAWRRIAFWVNYFYRIFAKKRHRSILLGGDEDSLKAWFDHYNVIPSIEILGCVTNGEISEENRKHLLGNLSEMESICNRTGCRELLVVSNYSGSHQFFDIKQLEALNLKVYLLIGSGEKGNYALVDLKNLH